MQAHAVALPSGVWEPQHSTAGEHCTAPLAVGLMTPIHLYTTPLLGMSAQVTGEVMVAVA